MKKYIITYIIGIITCIFIVFIINSFNNLKNPIEEKISQTIVNIESENYYYIYVDNKEKLAEEQKSQLKKIVQYYQYLSVQEYEKCYEFLEQKYKNILSQDVFVQYMKMTYNKKNENIIQIRPVGSIKDVLYDNNRAILVQLMIYREPFKRLTYGNDMQTTDVWYQVSGELFVCPMPFIDFKLNATVKFRFSDDNQKIFPPIIQSEF